MRFDQTLGLDRRCYLAGLFCVFALRSLLAVEPCRIEVLDSQNQWPVPLVELRTNHGLRYISDNAGVIAMDAPELMDRETWFHVHGHGYGVPPDRFGFAGVRLTPRSGATLQVNVVRQLPAKRIGRLTGAGLFAESQKLGQHLAWQDQGILGCDSVQTASHAGRLFWGWGDTVLAAYPLGRFHMIGATTPMQPLNSFRPPLQLRYDYFSGDDGIPRNVAKMPGSGPTWLTGYTSLADESGRARLVATYTKIKPPLSEYETGLCIFDEDVGQFRQHRVIWSDERDGGKPPAVPRGHAVRWSDSDGEDWVLFGDPFPTLRCRDTFENWSDPDRWQQLEPPQHVEAKETGDRIVPHRGAIAWNGFRNRWVAIFTQLKGKSSTIGEIWYAESDSPLGEWKDALHVVTHDGYSFYNPLIHPEFVDSGSPVLLFEATYTRTFSRTDDPTPRHDYNQVLYRLDLDESDVGETDEPAHPSAKRSSSK